MPPRNLWTILLAAVVSLACYLKAVHNRYASTVASAMERIRTDYVEPVNDRQLFENAMRGMVRELDPYSAYIPPGEYKQWEQELDQEFGGIGIVVQLVEEDGRPIVTSPIPDSPAYRAGIRAGDVLLEVDGIDTANLTNEETVKRVQGRPGTKVRIRVLPYKKTESVEYVLERAIVPIDSVLGDVRLPNGEWTFRLEQDPRIGYLRVTHFGEQTAEEVKQTLQRLTPDLRGLILDLRDNPGGLLAAAVEVCDLFIAKGEIVREQGRNGRLADVSRAKPGNEIVDQDVPLVVLVDRWSASASEVVAACLQDHGRAKIVGERTWGKGTVQRVVELEGGRSALTLTTETYHRPSGRNIHKHKGSSKDGEWGVVPDEGFVVELDKDERTQVLRSRLQRDAVVLDEEHPTGGSKTNDSGSASDPPTAISQVVDRQLQKGVDHLQSLMRGGNE